MAEPPEPNNPQIGSVRPGAGRLPPKVAELLGAAIKRSVDKALHESGVALPGPKENDIVRRVSQEVTVAFQHEISASYEGPLPPPEMLAQFDQVVPGLSREIVDMAVKEQSHRHLWERRALLNDMFMQSGALALGWILAGGALIGAFYFGITDRPVEMGIMLGVSALQMVRAIVGGGGQGNEGLKSKPPAPAPKPRDKKRR